MESATETAIANIRGIQSALLVLSSLELNLWPRQNDVCTVQKAANAENLSAALVIILDGSSFDFVIVGAGVAGCVLANRLTEDENVKVLLIEAGKNPHYETLFPDYQNYLYNTEMDYNYTAACDGVHNRCHNSPRFKLHIGKALGGSSSIVPLLYYQGTKQDYQRWADASNDSTWLWENVLPFYKKTERLNPKGINPYTRQFHGTKGYLGLAFTRNTNVNEYLEAFEDIGHDILPDINDININISSRLYPRRGRQRRTSELENPHFAELSSVPDVIGGEPIAISGTNSEFRDINGDNYIGYAKAITALDENNFVARAAYTYLTPIMDRPNLYVLKNTLVTELLIRNKVAIGVKAMTQNGLMTIFAKKEVIVSGGAIKSPQILMLSGIGPKEQLENKGIKVIVDLPVGENLQDRVTVIIVHKTKKRDGPPPRFDPLGPGPDVIIGNAALNKSAEFPIYQVVPFIYDNLETMIGTCAENLDYKYKICDQFYNKSQGRQVMFTYVIGLYAKSRGSIRLRSTNPKDSPKVATGVYSAKIDLENSIKFVEDFLKIEESDYFKSVKAEMIDPDYCKCSRYKIRSKAYWKCYNLCMSTNLGNFCGTCAMGSVVDGKLLVIGIKKLRVVDASVIPFITGGAVYPPTIVVAEKAADMIKQTWNLK